MSIFLWILYKTYALHCLDMFLRPEEKARRAPFA